MTFTKYGPTPCDKICCSEHQTLFLLFGEGLGTRLWPVQAFVFLNGNVSVMSHIAVYTL